MDKLGDLVHAARIIVFVVVQGGKQFGEPHGRLIDKVLDLIGEAQRLLPINLIKRSNPLGHPVELRREIRLGLPLLRISDGSDGNGFMR